MPPNAEVVERCIKELVNFLNEAPDKTHHALYRIGLFHVQFETIHPFLDGNGRLGRVMILLLLSHYGLLPQGLPPVCLSRVIGLNRDEYYDRLLSFRVKGEWEQWLHYFLRVIEDACDYGVAACVKCIELRKKHSRQISEKLGARATIGLQLLDDLYRLPMTTIPRVQRVIGKTYPTAHGLTNELVGMGILKPAKLSEKRSMLVYHDYVEIFR